MNTIYYISTTALSLLNSREKRVPLAACQPVFGPKTPHNFTLADKQPVAPSKQGFSIESFLRRLDRNQDGTISIVTVFAVLLLVMLLGMLMNVGRHVDGKIRLQNAADASAYSGGVVLTRGMNTLAFTNHLLSDVFALTAFMREARDGNSARQAPRILAAWNTAGQLLASSGFPKFDDLGRAIQAKVPLEQDLVTSFSLWAAASSEQTLPVLEEILSQQMIPEFQRAVVAAYPNIAQQAAMEIANRNGDPERGRGPMLGVLWRTSAVPVGGEFEYFDRSLPVVDPEMEAASVSDSYVRRARSRRRHYAELYLGVNGRGGGWRWHHGNWHARSWNDEALVFFDREAKMSQFGSLWRSFTCGYLERLLEQEYPYTNLPHLMRQRSPGCGCGDDVSPVSTNNAYLQQNFTFLAVSYWRELPQCLPGLFRNPTQSDSLAYAEVRMFIPRRRLQWYSTGPGRSLPDPLGNIGGQFPEIAGNEPGDPGDGTVRWYVGRQSVPTHWDLFNQHWTCQLVPTAQASLATILQTPPPIVAFAEQDIRLPNLGDTDTDDLLEISPH